MNVPDYDYPAEAGVALRLFLDSITDQAVYTVDPAGIIVSWNEGCRRLKGHSAEEAIGESFRMLYAPEDVERGHPEHTLRRAREDGEYHEEWTRMRKNGERYMAEVSIYPIEEDGRVVGFAKIVKDVTERRRLEDERDRLSERLKRSNRDLEGFCQSISHDLRGPIRAIVARSRILREDFAASLPDEATAHLAVLAKNGVRLNRIVDDLLQFARLGQGEVKRQDVDMSAMARRLAAELAPRSGGGCRIEAQDGVHAVADGSMIELVLRNLLENACKYSRQGAHVRFGTEVVGDESTYFVRDDGIGFDMAYAERIFEPFERLHGVDAYEGTGIGLANVRRIVERHGGRVWAESQPGHGSTFRFTLG